MRLRRCRTHTNRWEKQDYKRTKRQIIQEKELAGTTIIFAIVVPASFAENGTKKCRRRFAPGIFV